MTPAETGILPNGLGSVTVERNVACPMRDGTLLRADVYRPTTGGPFPVIVIRLPYDKTGAENVSYAHPSWYASRGYIVVAQDNRGRYASEGTWHPFVNETDDGYDTIEWAAKLPGSNGKVGMYGFSYAGATQLMPATQRPPSLSAICPAMTASRYDEGWTHVGGALNLAFITSWAMGLGIQNARQRRDLAAMGSLAGGFANSMGLNWVLPLTDHPVLNGEDTAYFAEWLAHPAGDPYWEKWSIEKDFSRITVPALHIAGWYDVFLTGTVRNYVGLRDHAGSPEARANQRLLIGPWFHIPWKPLTVEGVDLASPNVVDDWQVAFFDETLKGGSSTLPEDPVSVFVLNEGRWRGYAAWPPPEAALNSYYLHSDGRANSRFGNGRLGTDQPGDEQPDVYTYDPGVPMLSQGGHSCCFAHVAPLGPANQEPYESWNGVLVYTTAPVAADTLMVGNAEVELFAATSAVDTDWTARLCHVSPDGISTNIQEGIIRARFRNGNDRPEMLEPNAVTAYRIDLGPVGVMIPAGWRIRLDVSSSDFPMFDRNLNSGGPIGTETMLDAVVATQTVFHDSVRPSRLILPILPQ